MPKPRERASLKKFRKTISGTKIDYVKGKNKKIHCGMCKAILHGVPHSKTKAEINKLSKTKKRPEVVFGGVLCSKCRTKVVKNTTKVKYGELDINEVPLDIKGYVEQMIKKVG